MQFLIVLMGVAFLCTNALGYAMTPSKDKEQNDKAYKMIHSIALSIALVGLAI